MHTYYETSRLILKILLPENCHSVLRFYKENHDLFSQSLPFLPEHYYTADYQRSVLALEHKNFINGKGVRFYVYLKENPKRIIGTISFSDIKYNIQQSAVTGYRFASAYHHQGYALESMQQGLKIMFEEEHLHRIEAFIQRDNTPSIQLAKRLGFQYEGTSYGHTMIRQQWHDMERYSILSNATVLHQ